MLNAFDNPTFLNNALNTARNELHSGPRIEDK